MGNSNIWLRCSKQPLSAVTYIYLTKYLIVCSLDSSDLSHNSCQVSERTEECSAVFHKQNGTFVPSDLLDFLSEDEMKGELDMGDLECLNYIDLELDISLRGEWYHHLSSSVWCKVLNVF